MKKPEITDLLVPNKKLAVRKINHNDPKRKARIKRHREEMAKIKYRIDHFDRKQLLVTVKTSQF